MKKRIVFLAILFAFTVCFVSTVSAKTTLRIAHAMPEIHGYHFWATNFKTELAKIVGDQIDVQIFPNGQLGKETEYLEAMKMGTVDGAIHGRHGQIDIRLDVLNLPLIYRDRNHLDMVLRANRPVQQRLDSIMLERGYKTLGWGELGFRHITTKDRLIHKASDLKGLDIRVPNVPSWLVAFKTWGANPTPMDFSELYSALQQGVVKAQENPPEIIFSSKFYEVQKYLNMTSHANIPCEFTVSKKFWEGLSPDLQKAVMSAATISRDMHVKYVRNANDSLVAELKKKGMVIVTDIDKASFIPGAEAAYKANEQNIGKDLIEAVRNTK